MKTILFDVDGVFADFTGAFTELCSPGEGYSCTDDESAHVLWNFTNRFPASAVSAAWQVANHRWQWWQTLNSLEPASTYIRIARMTHSYQIVFCTNRVGTPNAQVQTQRWLAERLGPEYLVNYVGWNVILSKYKGETAKVLQADYAIDDKPENVQLLKWMTDDTKTPTKVYIMDRPYNRVTLPRSVRRVSTVAEFLDDVEEGR